MKTAAADTSVDAYRAHRPRDLSAGQARVMAAIQEGRDYSRAELAEKTGLPLQSICGRVNELVAAKRLEHGPRRPCGQTGQ